MKHPSRFTTLVLLAATTSGGCAWMVTRSPSPDAAARRDCPSAAPAGIDAYQAVGGALGALLLPALALPMAVSAAIHAASASYGFKVVRACKQAHEQMMLAGAPPLPLVVVPPASSLAPPDAAAATPREVIDEVEEETIERRTRTTIRTRARF